MRKVLQAVFVLIIVFTASCGRNVSEQYLRAKSADGEIASEAERFSLQKHDNYTTLTIINPWQGAKDISLVYYLVKKELPLPEGIDSTLVIRVPIKSIICMSTTYISMIAALNEENTIRGISGKELIYSDILKNNIESGLLSDVGFEASLNKELIIKIAPDLVMMYGIGSESSGYIGKIKELGVNILYNADYLETDPLKKAEWIKVFGALYCKESLADTIFKQESQSYFSLKSYIQNSISERPKVLLGLPYRDTWYVSPGNSFISKLISDAGGEYLWQNTESEISMPYGIENVYLQAVNADYWLNIGTVESRNEISVYDERLMELPCVIKGNLYNNIKRSTLTGGNDYWESGTLFPHLILKDIASILHPGLFPDAELFFYKKLN